MKPPKYRFSLGKNIEASVTRESAGTIITQQIPITPGGSIYLDYSPSKELGLSGQALERVDIVKNTGGSMQADSPGVYSFDSSVSSIALRFTGYSQDLQDLYDSFVRDGFSKVYEFYPVNPCYKSLSKKYTKENNQIFFRASLSGNIKLLNTDFDLVYGSSLDTGFVLFVEKFNDNTEKWYEYYKGKFGKTDCKFDFSKKQCELKLSTLDQYNKVLDRYEDTYDLIKLAPAISKIDMCKRPVLQVYVAGDSTISSYFGGTYWESEVNDTVDDPDVLIRKYHFSALYPINEFSISGSPVSDYNGVYAGEDGVYKNANGITVEVVLSKSEKNPHIVTLKDNSGEIAYMSYVEYEAIKTLNTGFIYLDTGGKYIDLKKVLGPNDLSNTEKIRMDNIILYKVFQRLLCDVDSVGGVDTFDLPADDFVSDNRNYKKCIGISSGQIFYTVVTSDKPTKYGVNDYDEYFTNIEIYNKTGIRPLPVARSSWANASLWYCYNTDEYKAWEKQYRKAYTLNDSYSIGAVIKVLLAKIDPSITHNETTEYSRFLYSSEQIPSVKWNAFRVHITQKTNILKGEYDQAAQKAEITLKQVMDMLCKCFKCYWYIENGKLKIEHISYFLNGGSYSNEALVQLDFSRMTDMFNKKLTSYFQSEIEYDKSELFPRYEFDWQDDVTELFGPVNIDVKANYLQDDKKEEVSPDAFSSDVDFMLLWPSNFSDDGFALLCPVKNGYKLELPIVESKMFDENGKAYDMSAQNWYASWPYLVNFYKFDMPAYNIDADVLAIPMDVYKIKKCMSHTIEFPTSEDLNSLELIATSLGEGTVDEIDINMNTRLAKVRLLYTPK